MNKTQLRDQSPNLDPLAANPQPRKGSYYKFHSGYIIAVFTNSLKLFDITSDTVYLIGLRWNQHNLQNKNEFYYRYSKNVKHRQIEQCSLARCITSPCTIFNTDCL